MMQRARTGWPGLLLTLALCLAGLLSTAAHAGRVDISAVERMASLHPALTVLRDPTGALRPEEVAHRSGLPASTPGALSVGFTTDTIWLQLRVGNESATPQTRWLSVGHTRLEEVTLYQLDAGGQRVMESWVGGVAQPLAKRPIVGKESLFPVTLAPGEEALLLLRLQGRTTMALDVSLWAPLHYREQEAVADLSLLVPAGALLVVSLYLLVSALFRRDKSLVLLALWLGVAVVCELTLQGYLYRYVLTAGGEPAVRAPIFFIALTVALAAAFIHTFIVTHRAALLSRLIRGVSLAGFALALGSTFGPLDLLAGAFVVCTVVLCMSSPFLLFSAWRQRHPNIGLFIFALTGLLINVVTRLLIRLDILPPGELSSASMSIVYALGLGSLALLGVVQRTIAQHETTLAQQRALLQAQQAEHARLEAAIDSRTRALQGALIAADEASRAKSDFLARVSHDLRAPLTAILGYADLIIGSGGRPADHGRVIRRSAQHLLGLLNDLIAYARGGSGNNALQALPVYAASLLTSIAAEGEALARRNGNRFEYQLSGELPTVIEIDEKRLRQILINLLDNAAKFTRNGHIRFSVQCPGEHPTSTAMPITFVVEDDGPGMSATELAHIFEPFHRLTSAENHEGLGLGLAISRQWVECMGGDIQAESTPGQGTRLQVSLAIKPASEDALPYPHQVCQEDRLPELDGSCLCVWVVEDSHEIRNLLCLELRSQGFTPVPIANGHDARSLLASPDTRPPDLVLTDLKMPFASGEDVLAGVRAKWPSLPVVLLTATPDAVLQPASAGAAAPHRPRFSAILSKPVSFLLLRQTLAEQLGLPWPSSEPGSDPSPAITPPSAARLAEAHALIRMGAISDLIDWADSLGTEDPAWAPFATHARELAERGEMAQLLHLCSPPSARSESA